MDKAFKAVVRGIVQGVSFRYYTRRAASPLGLTGFVTNLPDGSVEVVAEGDEAKLKELEAWLEHGPPSAVVERVDVTWSTPEGRYTEFRIRH